MNINRNNYEEYFLLYADKELTAEEKNMVEMFVQQNPDLEEEFVMLQQSVIEPDNTIELKDKSFLLRKEILPQAGYINQNNYEEKFLLYTDNELSLSEIEETEKFVLLNPSLQDEFTLIQQVKYNPDPSIVFPDKDSLYKKGNNKKIISFRWEALAAAVLLGAGFWIGIGYLQKTKTEPVLAKQNVTPKKNTAKPIEPKVEVEDITLIKTKTDQSTSQKVDKSNVDNPPKNHLPIQQNIALRNNQSTSNVPKANNWVEKKNEDIVINRPLETKKEVIKTNELPQPGNNISEAADKNVNALPLQQNNYSNQATYIADAEIKSENYVFYNITTEEFNKSKVGTFLKKVKRTIERKNPLKNNKYKIGTVEIATDKQN
ncbi:MAG TPA: hypothetical protein VGP43_01285 [Chitinophagaceae bacterium]|nr:hypothetical protein [Chitinophagaceae bacterium]